MKYFLAIDKGHFRKQDERYIKIDLSSINAELVKDNNLKNLTKFTCSFENKHELRTFLISKGLINPTMNMYDIVIYYELSYIRTVDIAFKCDEEYLDIGRLSAIIFDKCKSKIFLETFINYYSNDSFLSEEVGLIREYADDPYATHRFFDAIRGFINRLCYRDGKNLNYKQLYDLGMFVSKLSNKGRKVLINSIPFNKETQEISSFVPQEDSDIYDKWEELQKIQADMTIEEQKQVQGQTRLF